MEKKITVGNVCFLRDKAKNRLLLLHRSKDPMKNLSTGVGGKTDFHEDINDSCYREVYEETGIKVDSIKLKGILKTLVDGGNSSWILFSYLADIDGQDIQECDEGELRWVALDQVYSHNLVGFIRRVLPHILDDQSFFEGTITHDMQGNIVTENIKLHPCLLQ